MRSFTALSFCLTALPAVANPAADPDLDLLRFSNGDALHGKFEGIGEGPVVNWSGSTFQDTIQLQTDKLRRIALNGGRATKSLSSPSFIQLPNGDQIPGSIVQVDADNITVETVIAGTLTIPREHVSSFAPNPHGGAVHYIGPFSPDGWEIMAAPKKENALEEAPRQRRIEPDPAEEEKAEDAAWVFGGGAWYSNAQLPISINANMPDKARIGFRLAWRNRLSAVVSFHSTLKVPDPPEPGKEDEEGQKKKPVIKRQVRGNSSGSYPLTYGHSYVLTVYSSYAMLYRCDFDEKGEAKMNRLSSASANIRLDDSGDADFELRCDREEASIALFVDGQFVSQWEDPDGYAGTGGNLTFACQNSTSRLRVSDVVVSSWNGMIDSARSMDSEKRDVVLLTNGTDRFSGELVSIEDGKAHLRGTYADLHIPMEEIQEVRFAKDQVGELAAPSGKAIRLRLQPVGRLTVDPVSGNHETLNARSAALGEVDIDLRYASILEFSFSDSILDSWDDDF